jgi:pseudaminic acid biosynthesis-associated methylase
MINGEQQSAFEFWTGQDGDAYIDRNELNSRNVGQRVGMWRRVFDHIIHPYSILEVGASVGINLAAIKQVLPPIVKVYGVEPNDYARAKLRSITDRAIEATADDIPLGDCSVDVVFTSGVLIHIEPEKLLASCREMHRVASRYIVCAEYFSDKPQQIEYRGSYIWKRDFGKFWLDNFEDLRPIGCGFEWRSLTGIDNLTWWVFEKC